MGRRRRRRPLEGVRLPWILRRLLAGEQTVDEIPQKKDLRCAENQRAPGDEYVPVLHRLQKFILGRVVDAPHMAGNAEKMHRKKSAVKKDVSEHKMYSSQRPVHLAVKDFRKPIINRGKQREND